MKSQCLPFAQIPHTTRLFTDFLKYTPAVKPFYPHSPHFSEWVMAEASSLKYDPGRRERVSAILERQNKSWEASPQTLANLDRFRNGAAAIVTGQQVGLFGGPMFAIYKALSAVKLADEATAAGVDAVPIFWLATYDHDLAEVNHVSIPGPDGSLRTLTTSSHSIPGAPVSEVRLGDEIVPVVEEAVSLAGRFGGFANFARVLSSRGNTGLGFRALLCAFVCGMGSDCSRCLRSRTASNRCADLSRSDRAACLKSMTRCWLGDKLWRRLHYHQQVKVTASSVLVFTLAKRRAHADSAHPDGGDV